MNLAIQEQEIPTHAVQELSTWKPLWQEYVEKGSKVFLFVSTQEQYAELRERADRLYPRADIIIVISQETINTGHRLNQYVMIRVS